ncbi:MAG: sulfite exporter TauE/SafE family protein [Deinococcus sp.]|nr:sulfite exporter TauE/SafE family protein [Deinococcus sp.]
MLLIFLIAVAVGGVGGLLGLGGGIFLIPIFTVFLDIPIRLAIGASIISVVATSSAAGTVYVGAGLTHTRLAMVLEIATTLGALAGGLTALLISPRALEGLFGLVLLYVLYTLLRPQRNNWASPTGLLDTSYRDPATSQTVTYGVRHLSYGLATSFVAGNVSGLLGIGGGPIKVPAMHLIMGIPLKAAIATSNFMIGVTAATSAVLYYARGYVDPVLAVPTALGVLLGAQVGSRLAGRVHTAVLARAFQLVLLYLAVQMLWKTVRG